MINAVKMLAVIAAAALFGGLTGKAASNYKENKRRNNAI